MLRNTLHSIARSSRPGLLCCTVVCACAAAPAMAAYPDKPVRLVVPSSPGGGTDTTMRIITPRLGDILGQRIVIDNRPGQAGNIGLEVAAHAPADGYTLAAMIASNTSNPALMKNIPFNLERDFVPVSLAVVMPNMLIAHPSLPVKSVKEFIALAKARPGQIDYASPGVGSTAHLAMELLISMTDIKLMHIPYKSGGAAFLDVVAGHAPIMFGNVMSSLQHVRSGRVRALGVTSLNRVKTAPEIPAISEAGFPGYEATTWYGVLAPAGTPRAIVNKVHDAIVQTVRDQAVANRFVSDGAEPMPSASPDEFAGFIRSETMKWAKVVKNAGITPQ
jgi:tripartite-type tricarboxylate transporter receptor subunit TctC